MKWIGLISGVAGLLLISSRAGFVLLIYVCPVSVGALPTSREPPPGSHFQLGAMARAVSTAQSQFSGATRLKPSSK